MATIRAEYLALADILTLFVTGSGPADPLPSPGPIQVWLQQADGRFAGLRMVDFSALWPEVNKDQLAHLTSKAVIDLLDDQHAHLPPSPAVFELAGAALHAALAEGFSLEIELPEAEQGRL